PYGRTNGSASFLLCATRTIATRPFTGESPLAFTTDEASMESTTARLAIAAGTILFKPDSGWQWVGWDGKLQLESKTNLLFPEGKGVIRKPDLIALGMKLAGKNYKASGFDDIPGSSIVGNIQVDELTLSDVLECEGQKVATAKTIGTFTI